MTEAITANTSKLTQFIPTDRVLKLANTLALVVLAIGAIGYATGIFRWSAKPAEPDLGDDSAATSTRVEPPQKLPGSQSLARVASVASVAVTEISDIASFAATADDQSRTGLHHAVLSGCGSLVKLMLENGAKMNPAQDGLTPLHFAAMARSAGAVQYLLEQDGVDVNAVDKSGATPLHVSAENGNPEIMAAILGKHPVVNVQNRAGATPFMVAVTNQHVDCAAQLIGVGASVDSGHSLHAAVKNRDIAMVEMLTTKGANVNLTDADGNTALHVACQLGLPDIAKVLLQQEGLNRDLKNNAGRTAHSLSREPFKLIGDVFKEFKA